MAEKPEDLNLPNAVIGRLIKESLPEGVNVSKEARSAISKAASVFVLYATSCANSIAQKSKRKTLTATDVFKALDEIEFDEFVPPLKESLELFKKEQKEKKDAAEVKRKKSAETSGGESGPESKKQKQDEDNIDEENKNGNVQEETNKEDKEEDEEMEEITEENNKTEAADN